VWCLRDKLRLRQSHASKLEKMRKTQWSSMLMQQHLYSMKDQGSNGLLADLSAMDWPSDSPKTCFDLGKHEENTMKFQGRYHLRGLHSTKAKGPNELMANQWLVLQRRGSPFFAISSDVSMISNLQLFTMSEESTRKMRVSMC
jgi:hypothetical protein